MKKVTLRELTVDNYLECIKLEVEESQKRYVTSNERSLAEAKVNPNLTPLAIYDVVSRGYELPKTPMVGFIMYEIADNVGFILRVMIDKRFQRQGYGRAAIKEVIRRLKLYPEVEMIATSHQSHNEVAAHFFHSLGFVEWDFEEARENKVEAFLRFQEGKAL